MQQPMRQQLKLIGTGMLFALLWRSASTIAKIGLLPGFKIYSIYK